MQRGPLASRNVAPIYANLGVPVQRDAAALDAGHWSLGWELHWASHSVRERSGRLELELDGETQRHDLGLRVGLGHGLTLDLSIPWIRHTGGSLDPLIEGWHDFWGLPNGARDDQPRDAVRFAYNGPGGLLLDSPASGLGDVELGVAWALGAFAGAEVASFAQFKFDTGDPADLTGSGDDALAAGLRVSMHSCATARLSCHAHAGYVHSGDSAIATDAEGGGWFAGFSLAWSLGDRWTLVGQLDAQANPYTEDPLATAGTPLWGTLGLRWLPVLRSSEPGAWVIEGSFSEDLVVGSAPDITFLLSVSRSF